LRDRRLKPDEHNVLEALSLLASESRIYRLHLADARPLLERLADDVDDPAVGLLLTSVATALAEPQPLGCPGQIERLALAVLRELRSGA
jgi:hypothetical protein